MEGKMAYEAFDSETLHILGGAMDEAWRRVKLNHLNGAPTPHARSLLRTFSLWPEKASGTLSVSLPVR
jgi:hypothetical protein